VASFPWLEIADSSILDIKNRVRRFSLGKDDLFTLYPLRSVVRRGFLQEDFSIKLANGSAWHRREKTILAALSDTRHNKNPPAFVQ